MLALGNGIDLLLILLETLQFGDALQIQVNIL